MLAVPTCTVAIYRGSATNPYGDPIDDNTTPLYTGISASILTGPRITERPVDGSPRVIRLKTCRLPNGTDVKPDDRIRNLRSGQLYTVDQIVQPENVATTTDVQLNLRRVT